MILIGFLIKQQDIGMGIERNDSEKVIVNNKKLRQNCRSFLL